MSLADSCTLHGSTQEGYPIGALAISVTVKVLEPTLLHIALVTPAVTDGIRELLARPTTLQVLKSMLHGSLHLPTVKQGEGVEDVGLSALKTDMGGHRGAGGGGSGGGGMWKAGGLVGGHR